MKTQYLNSQIKKKLIKSGIIIAVLAAILIGAVMYNSSSVSELENMNNQIGSIQSQLQQKRSEYSDSESQLNEYLSINKEKLPSQNGYESGRERLKISYPVFQSLKDIYFFKKLNFSLSEVKPAANIQSSNYTAFENVITMDYAGATDEYIFSMINDLKNQLPGYLTLKSLTMKKDKEIDQESANTYVANPDLSFVSGRLELNWITLKSNLPVAAEGAISPDGDPVGMPPPTM